MSFPVTITYGSPDPSLKMTNYADLFTLLGQNTTGTVNQDVQTFVYSYDTPAPDEQELLWFRLDSDGRLKGIYNFFNSVWVREEPPVSARFGFFTGNPTDYFDGTGLGLKGAGPIAGDYWGWALMNGNNGTPNLSNRFLIMGAMDNVGITGFDDNWRTNVNGVPEVTGGNSEVTLEASNIPELIVGRREVTGGGGDDLDDAGTLYGTNGAGTSDHTIFGSSAPTAVEIVNPFYALAIIQFVGYTG